MPSWPSTLPDYVLESGYQERLEDQKIESQVDAGPAKIRRRFTTNTRRFSVTIQMTAAQAVTFEDFFLNTLQGGSLTFDWVHPRTRVAKTFRFRNPPPAYTARGDAVFASFAMESLP